MKRLLAGAVLLPMALLPARAGSNGERTEHTFTAPVPCSVVCPTWLPTNPDPCAPEPQTLPLSFDDWDITLDAGDATEGVVFMTYGIEPLVDYDVLMCAREPFEYGSYVIDFPNCLSTCEPCTAVFAIGCKDHDGLIVCAEVAYPPPAGFTWVCLPDGMPVTMRVYNWADPSPTVVGFICGCPWRDR